MDGGVRGALPVAGVQPHHTVKRHGYRGIPSGVRQSVDIGHTRFRRHGRYRTHNACAVARHRKRRNLLAAAERNGHPIRWRSGHRDSAGCQRARRVHHQHLRASSEGVAKPRGRGLVVVGLEQPVCS